MFKSLADNINQTLKRITGKGQLSNANIAATIKEIKHSLVDADVNIGVIKQFIENVTSKAMGIDVHSKLNPGQTFVKILLEELTNTLGQGNQELSLRTKPPAVILLAGLQGAGKTTTAAKLAIYLQQTLKKKVMLTSCDIYRPAALTQLQTLAEQINVPYYITHNEQPTSIVQNAINLAKKSIADVLIIDTAGRTGIDTAMMDEIKIIHQLSKPIETLFVVDSMTGQDAANTAKAFADAVTLTGVILTKTDGDSRGGAALSVSQVSKQPIKFIGVGEKINDFEKFHPDRIAKRILGMGDMLTLIENMQRDLSTEKATKLTKTIKKGKSFNFNDLRSQLQQLDDIGGAEKIMKMMPGMSGINSDILKQQNSATKKSVAIINSMTTEERKFPKLLNASRKKRIACGSGTTINDINVLNKQLLGMQKMMKKITSKQKMLGVLGSLKNKFPTSML